MERIYEIFLKHGQVGVTEWNQFLLQVADYLGSFSEWEIRVCYEQGVIHYYLITSQTMPTSLELIDFLLKPAPELPSLRATSGGVNFNRWNDNFSTITQDFRKHQRQVICAELRLHNIYKFIYGTTYIFYRLRGKIYQQRLLLFSPAQFLSINFDKSKSLLFKKFPKYLKLEKVTRLLNDNPEQALLEIDSFPYFDSVEYLHHDSYDFAKHSLVIGGSGSGKSKFLASLIDKIYQTNPDRYKVVVIDPHDALHQDCENISAKAVINFQTLASSIDLFQCRTDDVNAGVELTLTLFQSLINDSYNGRLERVLRYATYLLISAKQFSFLTLRKLLIDLEYRNQVLAKYQHELPVSVSHFFLTDFNELKAQNYNDSIAPIIAFIDEMQMIPVFNSEEHLPSLNEKVQSNFLNLFSLNRLKLGNKVVQTIAGLLMQQLFLLAEQKLEQHLIIIIDEVSVVENPIIARFLSELRKYHASVILAGQYFDQISPDLRSAIFANTSNYYLFRVSQSDADLLSKNLKIKVEGSDDPDDSKNLLTGLKSRECLVQISADDEILPIFKARTTDFSPTPTVIKLETSSLLDQEFVFPTPSVSPAQQTPLLAPIPSAPVTPTQPTLSPPEFDFQLDDTLDISTFTKTYSTSRKVKQEKN